jgi:hypothetical protein
MRSELLFFLLVIGIAIAFCLLFIHFGIWIFSLGHFPNLSNFTYWIGWYCLIMFLINILFGFKRK